ncbi:Stk1 family PASTA domain-containing Ser/Thr kinase [Gryllotalpicola sp.]|uniref:Stk1 family PASTA domain-containing Ser/Thr kinase n=1 Tax=Gryllotalpicola sp. TaxID=1932787 RepID=UPI002637CB34|nr:Stk1 family PASTA domain-containing Ser/Thr kinase [Gryllotalpicola sp.]
MTSTSQTDPLIGRLIDGRYQVRSRIARGGMATVYLATDLRLERRVAVKVMHSHLADDTSFKNRFIQEARSAARLAHPNVVNVFDQGQDADTAYLVMEYLPGITLRDLLRDYGKLTPEQTMDIMESVLAGLAAAHRAGIVHRDLKPENVLLADDGRIKLGDFGLARAASKATGTGQALLGTIAYLSPELVTRGVADTRSDIYAIGIMMYEMLAGEQPFQGEQPMQIAYQHANDAVPRPSRKNPLVPPQLDSLVLWATAHNPEERPKDAGEMLDALLDVERATRSAGMGNGAVQISAAHGVDDTTRVLDPAELPHAQTAATQFIGARASSLTGPAAQVRAEASAADAVGRLATVSRGRRSRGWWLFSAVAVLAIVAGATGWWFGSGPGALIAVPPVAGLSAQSASAKLVGEGFVVTQSKSNSLNTKSGLVINSLPDSGTPLHKGDIVTIVVSQGPKPITLPVLANLSLAKATAAITGQGAVVGSAIDTRFTAGVAKGAVIAATVDGIATDVSQGGRTVQGATVDLVVSAGPIPNVAGLPLSEAEAQLTAVQLQVSPHSTQQYDNNVPNGSVISAAPEQGSGVVRPGDTMLLTISKGAQLFPVPNVVGEKLNKAINDIESDGFVPQYPSRLGFVPVTGNEKYFQVTYQSPDSTQQLKKGSTIALTISGTFAGG